MATSSHDLPQKSLQVKQNDKFFSRLMSKESSMANTSLRVYYGGASVAVPFMWESQPGTPKHSFCDTSLPPLTPPPSYHFNSRTKPIKKHSRSNLLHTMFPRLNLKRNHVSASPPLPSSSSLSSSSWTSSSSSNSRGRGQFSSSTTLFDSRGDEEDHPTFGSPTSTLCFCVRRGNPGDLQGGSSVVIMKNALLSIVGHGSRGSKAD